MHLPHVLGLLCCAALAATAGAAAAPPLRVLIFSGQNNHAWQETTPKLRDLLAAGGRFTVDVTDHPEQGTAEQFARYDVILSNWNAFGPAKVKAWPESVRQAFLQFIRGGKGLVVIHAGGSSFYDWPEYQQAAGAWWQMDRTSHGAPHTFTVTPAPAAHPVTAGLAPFQTRDELWRRPGVAPGAQVLATAEGEPVALASRVGQGRSFTLLLGHDAACMDNPGFQALLRRGAEWAATGRVAPPARHNP